MTNVRDQAADLLRRLTNNPDAAFRTGQLEAIEALVERRGRALVVQRTGWGKSAVYFIATRLLRDAGAGPTVLISPLLALMRNQILMAERAGVRAATINSDNHDDWRAIEADIRGSSTTSSILPGPSRSSGSCCAKPAAAPSIPSSWRKRGATSARPHRGFARIVAVDATTPRRTRRAAQGERVLESSRRDAGPARLFGVAKIEEEVLGEDWDEIEDDFGAFTTEGVQ